MKLLLDTHLLLWAAVRSDRLSARARERIEDERWESTAGRFWWLMREAGASTR